MSIIKKTALYFARKEFCMAAINERADLSVFKEKLTATVIIGLVLFTASYIIGIPAIFIVGGIAACLNKPMIGVIGIPLLYGVSWIFFMLGLYLAGPKYGKALVRWAVRVTLEKVLGDEAETIRLMTVEDSKSEATKK
ncbi:MAG: hypothetical protein NTW65_08820 [Deltaproteobacteria bacterium]|nr:hypothetical protein [Deltaproteobacteria bacterium]